MFYFVAVHALESTTFDWLQFLIMYGSHIYILLISNKICQCYTVGLSFPFVEIKCLKLRVMVMEIVKYHLPYLIEAYRCQIVLTFLLCVRVCVCASACMNLRSI